MIAGIRPENFEDASLVSEDDLRHGPTFRATIEVIEWMGSELYAYFTVGGGAAASELGRHADLSAEDVRASGEGTQVVARLNAASEARQGRGAGAVARRPHPPPLRPRHRAEPQAAVGGRGRGGGRSGGGGGPTAAVPTAEAGTPAAATPAAPTTAAPEGSAAPSRPADAPTG